ncbi:hypothetical protein CJ671_00675 [Aliarcobacter cryaerophilus]|uniref:Uncharacterized protein n=1 Tax=Aliarcobacter cryaerophilus TaxID=28198 RepID=A0A2S9SWB3_9BACT|nr:hypothetical protein [Aliarcobacter cryaerophilus]PRM90885.1 hypothetical protein CJ671_00675 [Aliarcobacter cryaerophilus]
MKKYIIAIVAFLVLWLFLDLYYIAILGSVAFLINYKMGDEIKKTFRDLSPFIKNKLNSNKIER